MRTIQLIMPVVLLALCGSAAMASEWERLEPADIYVDSPFRAYQSAPDSTGWWALSIGVGSGRQLLTRFDQASAETTVIKQMGPANQRARWRLAARSGGGVLLSSGWPCNQCFPTRLLLKAHDHLGELQWERVVGGHCTDLLAEDQGGVSLICDGRLHRLDAAGNDLHKLAPIVAPGRSIGELHRFEDLGYALLGSSDFFSGEPSHLALVDASGEPSWTRQLAPLTYALGFGSEHIYLHLGDQEEILILNASDGSESARISVEGVRGLAVVWRDLLRVIAVTETGQDQLLSINPAGEISTQTLSTGFRTRQMALSLPSESAEPSLFLARIMISSSTVGNGTVQVVRLGADGSTNEVSLPGSRIFWELYGLAGDSAQVLSNPLIEGRRVSMTLETIGGNGELLMPTTNTLPASAAAAQTSVDGPLSTLWFSGAVPNAGTDGMPDTMYLARASFVDSTTQVHAALHQPIPTLSGASEPVHTGENYCALYRPDNSLSREEFGPSAHLLCVPREGIRLPILTEVHLGGPQPAFNVLALGADETGQSIILSDADTGAGHQLYRSTVTPTGISSTVEGDFVEGPPAVYKPDLSGLLGRSLIDEHALVSASIGNPLADQPITGHWLTDGDLILVRGDLLLFGFQLTPLASGQILRLRPDGSEVWSLPLPVSAIGRFAQFSLASSDDLLVLEHRAEAVPRSRYLIDLNNGEIVSAEQPPELQESGPVRWLNLPSADGGERLWRLSTLTNGVLAEPISIRPQTSVWLPCGTDNCNLDAVGADPAGRALIQIYGQTNRELQLLLGTADLNSKVEQLGSVRALGSGRWHRVDDSEQGLLVGRSARDRTARVLMTTLSGTSSLGASTQARWWSLGAVSSSPESLVYEQRQPRMASAAAQSARLTITDRRVQLYPLADQEWLLATSVNYAERPGQIFPQSGSNAITQLAETAFTQVYFQTDDHWLAIDQQSGNGVWGRPDGQWLRLQRLSSGRWAFFDPGDPGRAATPTAETAALGEAKLSRISCKRVQWKVISSVPEVQRDYARDYLKQNFVAGECLQR